MDVWGIVKLSAPRAITSALAATELEHSKANSLRIEEIPNTRWDDFETKKKILTGEGGTCWIFCSKARQASKRAETGSFARNAVACRTFLFHSRGFCICLVLYHYG